MLNTLDTMATIMATLGPQMQRAAALILDNPDAVAVYSMRHMAQRAEVSPPTMLRLAQRLGFNNYEAFRDEFIKNIATGSYRNRADHLRQATGETGLTHITNRMTAAGVQGLERFRDPNFTRDMESVADAIVHAGRVIIIASGASFGQASSFHYVCRMALPRLTLANDGFGIVSIAQFIPIQKEDVVLAIATAPYAKTTIEASEYAHRQGAKILAITDTRSSGIAKLAASKVIIDTESPHYFPSMISLNAALEVLSAAIMVQLGDQAVQAISEYESELHQNGYYWSNQN
jgi:DNA-binding MurR/RpiR family transcriptional regulator